MKRIALINDLSGIGRCSLTVALPTVSAMGFECAVIPTAILSNHTGFADYTFTDFSDKMRDYISCWEKLSPDFSVIYSGFLGSRTGVDITLEFMEKFGKNAVKLVDPVMGDDGVPYTTCDGALRKDFIRLALKADVITPNLTELCILCDTAYPAGKITLDQVKTMCEKFRGGRKCVVTGLTDAKFSDIPENRIVNLVYENGTASAVSTDCIGSLFCGTGDVFASVLCGRLGRGDSLTDATRFAADFVRKCIEDTAQKGGEKLYGVQFEDKLHLLCGKADYED